MRLSPLKLGPTRRGFLPRVPRRGVVFPKTTAEWQQEYPALAVPVHGWVFDQAALPIPDNFGSVPINSSSGSPTLGTAFNGRGGGLSVETSGGSHSVFSSANVSWDCSGDWTMVVTWYRGPENSAVDTNYTVATMGATGARIVFLERAVSTALGAKNWLLPAANDGAVTTAVTMNFTDDPDDFSYNTGWDTAMVRNGTALHAYSWTPGGTVAYHEEAVVGASDDFTPVHPIEVLDSTLGDGLAGRQVRAIYLFEAALSRDQLDIYRRGATASQSEV